jgi:hypothetical protein
VIVRRINVNAFDLSGVVGQKRFEGEQIVSLDEQITRARVADGEIRNLLQQMKRHLAMMIFNRFLPDPVQRGHECGFPSILR